MDRNPTQTATGTGGAWIGTARTLTGIPTGTALRTATVAVAGLKGEGGRRSGEPQGEGLEAIVDRPLPTSMPMTG